jgi:hypothetical protein
MAFRATNDIPANALAAAKATARRLRQFAQARSSAFQAASIRRDEVISCWHELRAFRAALQQAASVEGIAAYAEAQEDEPGYDAAAEFNGLIAVVDAAIAEIEATFPKDATGFVLMQKFHASGTMEVGTFTATQLSTLRTRLNAIVAQVV